MHKPAVKYILYLAVLDEKGVINTIRHILFWNYTGQIKEQHKEKEALKLLQDSVATMNGHIDGLLRAEINTNIAGGYDLVFYAEFIDEAALKNFMEHPLHVAHRERCREIVTDRLCGDIRSESAVS